MLRVGQLAMTAAAATSTRRIVASTATAVRTRQQAGALAQLATAAGSGRKRVRGAVQPAGVQVERPLGADGEPIDAIQTSVTQEEYEEIMAEAASAEDVQERERKPNPYMFRTSNYSRHPTDIPAELNKGIAEILEGRNLREVVEEQKTWGEMMGKRAHDLLKDVLSERKGPGAAPSNKPQPPVLYGPKETIAYTLHQLLPQYGVGMRVLGQLADYLPGFKPVSMLDFGSGPGSMIWAARETWSKSLLDVVTVEPSRSMSQVAEHLLANFPHVMYRRSLLEVARLHKGKKFDLVVAADVLSELCSDADRAVAVRELWELTNVGGVVVLLERGNGWGFHTIKTARQQLILDERARLRTMVRSRTEFDHAMCVVAPCPHSAECPMIASSWCHFSQAAYAHPRTASNPANTHPVVFPKFSYFVARKTPMDQQTEHAPAQRVYLHEVPKGTAGPWVGPPANAGALRGAKSAESEEIVRKRTEIESLMSGEQFNAAESKDSDDGSNEASDEPSEIELELQALTQAAVDAKLPGAGQWARVLRPPILGAGHVTIDLCTPSGKMERRVAGKRALKTRQLPDVYRAARKVRWGAQWPAWHLAPEKKQKEPKEAKPTATKPEQEQTTE